MEFFEFVDIQTSEAVIQEKLTIDDLPAFCEEIEAVDEDDGMGRVVFFRGWGRFHIERNRIMGGVRFSVPDCPNGLCWSISTGHGPQSRHVTLHATINRTEQDEEFISTTRALLSTLKTGILQYLHSEVPQSPASPSLVLPDLRKTSQGQ